MRKNACYNVTFEYTPKTHELKAYFSNVSFEKWWNLWSGSSEKKLDYYLPDFSLVLGHLVSILCATCFSHDTLLTTTLKAMRSTQHRLKLTALN